MEIIKGTQSGLGLFFTSILLTIIHRINPSGILVWAQIVSYSGAGLFYFAKIFKTFWKKKSE
jgi:hypothetical protein